MIIMIIIVVAPDPTSPPALLGIAPGSTEQNPAPRALPWVVAARHQRCRSIRRRACWGAWRLELERPTRNLARTRIPKMMQDLRIIEDQLSNKLKEREREREKEKIYGARLNKRFNYLNVSDAKPVSQRMFKSPLHAGQAFESSWCPSLYFMVQYVYLISKCLA